MQFARMLPPLTVYNTRDRWILMETNFSVTWPAFLTSCFDTRGEQLAALAICYFCLLSQHMHIYACAYIEDLE